MTLYKKTNLRITSDDDDIFSFNPFVSFCSDALGVYSFRFTLFLLIYSRAIYTRWYSRDTCRTVAKITSVFSRMLQKTLSGTTGNYCSSPDPFPPVLFIVISASVYISQTVCFKHGTRIIGVLRFRSNKLK